MPIVFSGAYQFLGRSLNAHVALPTLSLAERSPPSPIGEGTTQVANTALRGKWDLSSDDS